MKKSTVYDVAKLAGVSVSTVSRYNNRKAFIAKEKIIAIEQAMFKLNFKPKATKRNSNTLRKMKIGTIVPTFESSYITSILNGMNHWTRNSPYHLLIESSDWTKARERKIIKQMADSGVDAIILVVSLLEETEIRQQVGDLPVLMIANLGEGDYPNLKIDNVIAGSIATTYLLQQGHRKIVHVHGPLMENRDAKARLQGYKNRLQEAGIYIDEDLIVDGGYHADMSFHAIEKLIKQGIHFTAVFAANDLSAYGVLQALHQHNIQVPQQVSVIGFDDLLTSSICTPSLTTIRQPLYATGQLAMQYIFDIMNSNSQKPKLPPVELIIRKSTAQAPKE